MRVDVVNDKVVCIADDWKALTSDEHRFLNECAWFLIWDSFNEDGHLQMGERPSNDSYKHAFYKIVFYAKARNIEVSDKIVELRDFYDKAVTEENALRRKQNEAEQKVKLWEITKKNGCGTCKYLKRYAEDGFKCMFSCEELQAIMYDEYNPITGLYEMFHQTGAPNEHCKYFVKTEIK